MAIGFIPIVGKAVSVTDKRETLIGAYAVGIAGMAALKAAGAEGVVVVVIYMILTVICCNIYWQIVPSIFMIYVNTTKPKTAETVREPYFRFRALLKRLRQAEEAGCWESYCR